MTDVTFHIRVGYRPFLFSYGESAPEDQLRPKHGFAPDHKITITTLGWSLQPLKELVDLCQQHKAQTREEKTTIYFMGTRFDYNGPWSSVEKSPRKLDTIDIDDQVKADIIKDAEECKLIAPLHLPSCQTYCRLRTMIDHIDTAP
jgi:chaperone BCS1